MPGRKYRRKRRKRRKMRRYRQPYNRCKIRLRESFVLVPDVNGNIQGQMNSHSLTNFFKNFDSDAFISLQEKDSIKALYDQYRPIGIKLQYIPRYPAGGDGPLQPVSVPSMAFAYDVDNAGSISYGSLLTKSRARIMSFIKPWTLYFKVPKASLHGVNDPALFGGWNNLQSETQYTSGGIRFATEDAVLDAGGQPWTSKLGAILVTYYMEVKERN